MTAYAEKLRDPRWQKKRLEILNRDKFTCQACNSTEKTLNVHHKSYKKGKNPWDYAKKDLITFCEDCHEKLSGTYEKTHVEPEKKYEGPFSFGVVFGGNLLCSICKNDNLHFENPTLKKNYEDLELSIPFWCEAGCSYNLIFSFHEGWVFTQIEDTEGKNHPLNIALDVFEGSIKEDE